MGKPAAPKTYTGQTIMPPPLSKTSLNSLSRCRGPSNSIPLRSFSTSSSLASIGPENPKFIEIPVPPQHQALPKIDVKGTLQSTWKQSHLNHYPKQLHITIL